MIQSKTIVYVTVGLLDCRVPCSDNRTVIQSLKMMYDYGWLSISKCYQGEPARLAWRSSQNRMIHQLDYSRYKDRMSQTGIKFGVDVLLIDPQNTSKIAKQKYCQTKKLTTHQGASYVIARRGQGFTDRLAI